MLAQRLGALGIQARDFDAGRAGSGGRWLSPVLEARMLATDLERGLAREGWIGVPERTRRPRRSTDNPGTYH